MAALTPIFYKMKSKLNSQSGLNNGDVHRILYNLQAALFALMNNLDDVGIAGTEFRSKIGTDLQAANNLLEAPVEGEIV